MLRDDKICLMASKKSVLFKHKTETCLGMSVTTQSGSGRQYITGP